MATPTSIYLYKEINNKPLYFRLGLVMVQLETMGSAPRILPIRGCGDRSLD